VTASVLPDKLPHLKIVGFNTLSFDLGNLVSPTIGFDAVLTNQEGLSKLVATLKPLEPDAPPRLATLLPRGCHCGGPFVDNHIERTSDLARAAHVLGQQGNDRGFPMQTAEGEMDCRNGSRL
jgi:hypothetical protein